MKQKIEPLNEDEKAWIGENLEAARSILAAYTKNSMGPFQPEGLNEALSAWSNRVATDRVDRNTLVNALGIAFGQLLAERLGLAWAVVTDEHGVDMAVHGMPGDILVFPTAAVAKRVANDDSRFFVDLYAQVSRDIGRVRSQVH